MKVETDILWIRIGRKKVFLFLGVFSILCLVTTGIVYLSLPETAGVGLREIFLEQLKLWFSIAAKTAFIIGVVKFAGNVKRNRWKRFLLMAAGGLLFVFLFTFFTFGWGFFQQGKGLSEFLIREQTLVRITLIWNVITYWLILAIVLFIGFYRRSRQNELETARLELEKAELEKKLAQAQLQTLRSQLHPHFLFNTLNAVSSLVRKGERGKTLKLLNNFGGLLRRTIDREEVGFVTLREELEFIGRYLEIEEIRFGERLKVSINLESGTENALVPNMILQPLVENAVRHGISESLNGGVLEIEAILEAENLNIHIYNDGPVLPTGWKPEEQNGVGLVNTLGRLRKIYGEKTKFSIGNRDKKGVEVSFSIPFERVDSEQRAKV